MTEDNILWDEAEWLLDQAERAVIGELPDDCGWDDDPGLPDNL